MPFWGFIKDVFRAFTKVTRIVGGPIVEKFRDVFMGKTTILGPQKAGKSTLGKILRGEGYFIDEYNHTSELILIKDGKVGTYETASDEPELIKLKIKHDVPGENFELWEEVIRKDKPKGIILMVDLYGLVQDGALVVDSENEFIDFEGLGPNEKDIVIRTTPKQKFQLQVKAFQAVESACRKNKIKVKAMMVFLNKCEKWQGKADIGQIIHEYKTVMNNEVNLTKFAKAMGLTRDIRWAETSLDESYHSEKLEPALKRFSKMYAEHR